jgi:glycerophosphoryl diester phosphodiesterase
MNGSHSTSTTDSLTHPKKHPQAILLACALLFMVGCQSGFTTTDVNHELAPFPELMIDNRDDFVVIAHRGASGYAPENTMPAMELAYEMNAEMIEVDVMLSRDGVPVLFHDAKVDELTDGKGQLKSFTLEELQALDAGSWFSEEYAGTTIPTLEELLVWAQDKMTLNIEIKTEAYREDVKQSVEPRVVALVEKYDMADQVIFSSFDYRILARLQELAPTIPSAVLYEAVQSGRKGPLDVVSELQADGFNCSWRQYSEDWQQLLEPSAVPVLIYTVNEADKMAELIQRGVSGIFSDYPDVLAEVAAAEIGGE